MRKKAKKAMTKKEYLEWKNIQPCKSEREQIMRAEKFIKREVMKKFKRTIKKYDIPEEVKEILFSLVSYHFPSKEVSSFLKDLNMYPDYM